MQRASQLKTGKFFTADVYRTLFDQSPDGILVLDLEGNLLASNTTAHRALGYSSEEFARLDLSLLNTLPDPDAAQLHHRKVMTEGRTEFELSQMTKGGTLRQVLVTTQQLKLSGRTLFHTTWHDISESKRVRTELNESIRNLKEEKAKAEAIINAIGDNVSIRDPNFRLLYQNQALTDAVGDHVGELCHQAFHGREQVCDGCPVALAFKDGKIHTAEQKLSTAAGQHYFESTASLVKDTFGNIIAAIEVTRNITDKKRAEQALREAHTRLEALLNAIPDMVLFKDTQGRWLVVNQAMEKAIGQTREELLGKVDEEIAPPDLAAMCRASDAKAMRATGPVHIEESMSSGGGETISLDTIKAPMYDEQGNLSGVVMVSRDITERKRLEAKTREQHATLENIVESTDNAIYSVDRRYCYTSFNQRHAVAMIDLYGTEIKVGASLLDSITEQKDRRRAKSNLDRAMAGEKVIAEDSFSRNKQLRHYEIAYNPISDSDGQVVGCAVYARDTTERRRAEEKMKASEKRLRDITANLGVGVYVLDAQGGILFMNPMAEQLWGWSLEELREKGVHDVVHYRRADGTPLPEEECEMLGVFRKGQPYTSTNEVFVRKDGTVFPISIIATPLQEGDEIVAAVMAFRDITAERELEAELLKIQKLESVGILAGGIAHDFNNLLQAILGSIYLARMNLEKFNLAAIPSLLKQAEGATEGAKELSFRLLTFAKGGAPVKKLAAIEKIVRNSISLSLSGSNIDCDVDSPPDLPPVEVDKGQLMQVFNNILINAKEAMPHGGTIGIKVNRETIPTGSALPLQAGKYLCISIRDSGCGIPKKDLAKIFDPYFSGKGMGNKKGSGLGLTICMAIARKHDGHISVESRLGQGSTFHIHIPASSQPHSVQSAEEGGGEPDIPKKRILFMDDDDKVRLLVGEMITCLGYEVECARHGEEAMMLFRAAQEGGRPFAGVVLDLTVKGGMGGDKAVIGLRQIDPRVKAVISSGYAENPVVKDFREYGFEDALPKPFTIDQLEELLLKF